MGLNLEEIKKNTRGTLECLIDFGGKIVWPDLFEKKAEE